MQPKRFLYEKMKELSNKFSGPMTVSSFQSTGKLTPQEFLEAGDALVQKFPAWEWAGGDKDVLPFLPPAKKFLILRNCPSYERAAIIDMQADEKDVEDGWMETHASHVVQKVETQAADEVAEVSWDDPDPSAVAEAPDDSAKAQDNFRLYDVTVVYDQYYCTPRVFLFGYSETDHSKPLTKEEMMEDVFSANREKTVTVDPHPFLKTPCISIHPCRHAETMQRILGRMADRMESEQEDLDPKERVPFMFPTYLALFVFLKFISSVVPTISYDISMDFDM